jgi:LacI family transcriptional regulator
MKVRLDEVARHAGVGLATVDRVLNERGGVTPDTARKVVDAARQLGWARHLPTVYRTGLRFEVVLGRREIPLIARINHAFERALPSINRGVVIQRTFVDDSKPDRIAQAIRQTRGNAIMVYGQEQESILDAIAEVTAAGVPVITMVSDLPTTPRLAYVGINHYNAGRAAAFFIARMAAWQGKFVAVCNSFQYRAHAERISGFRDGLAEYTTLERDPVIIEAKDNEQRARDLLTGALFGSHDIAGIYNAGILDHTMAQCLASGPSSSGRVVIGHDLTVDSIRMLQDGSMTLVIDQSPDVQVRQALDILFLRFGLSERIEGRGIVPFTLHTKDNI